MKDINELEIQILDRVEEGGTILHPRLVLDESLGDTLGGDGSLTWVMDLFDVDRLSNVFHFN